MWHGEQTMDGPNDCWNGGQDKIVEAMADQIPDGGTIQKVLKVSYV